MGAPGGFSSPGGRVISFGRSFSTRLLLFLQTFPLPSKRSFGLRIDLMFDAGKKLCPVADELLSLTDLKQKTERRKNITTAKYLSAHLTLQLSKVVIIVFTIYCNFFFSSELEKFYSVFTLKNFCLALILQRSQAFDEKFSFESVEGLSACVFAVSEFVEGTDSVGHAENRTQKNSLQTNMVTLQFSIQRNQKE